MNADTQTAKISSLIDVRDVPLARVADPEGLARVAPKHDGAKVAVAAFNASL